MAIYASPTSQINELKSLYLDNDEFMVDLVFKENPGLALVEKDESLNKGMGGKNLPIPVTIATPAGRSAAFSSAQTNQTPSVIANFNMTRIRNYQLVTIDNELLEATIGDAQAFIEAGKQEMDTGFRNLSNDLALDLFSDGSGARGSFGLALGSISTGVITLDNPATAVNFGQGQALASYSVSGSTPTQSTSAALGYVIAVDYSKGTVTVSATQGGSAGTPTNWSTSFPYLSAIGDTTFASNGLLSANMVKLSGYGAWLPLVAPTAGDNFFGQDRSVNPTFLAGNRFDGRNEAVSEALIDIGTNIYRIGGRPETCFVNPNTWAALEKAEESKTVLVQASHGDAEMFYPGLTVMMPYGPVTVIADRSCPTNVGYLINEDDWKLRSMGRCPHIIRYGQFEGLEGVRVYNADAVEIRLGYYAQLVCRAPGWSGVVQLSD